MTSGPIVETLHSLVEHALDSMTKRDDAGLAEKLDEATELEESIVAADPTYDEQAVRTGMYFVQRAKDLHQESGIVALSSLRIAQAYFDIARDIGPEVDNTIYGSALTVARDPSTMSEWGEIYDRANLNAIRAALNEHYPDPQTYQLDRILWYCFMGVTSGKKREFASAIYSRATEPVRKFMKVIKDNIKDAFPKKMYVDVEIPQEDLTEEEPEEVFAPPKTHSTEVEKAGYTVGRWSRDEQAARDLLGTPRTVSTAEGVSMKQIMSAYGGSRRR